MATIEGDAITALYGQCRGLLHRSVKSPGDASVRQVLDDAEDAVFYRNSGGGVTLSAAACPTELRREIVRGCAELGIHVAWRRGCCVP
jgi:hypothetical protein